MNWIARVIVAVIGVFSAATGVVAVLYGVRAGKRFDVDAVLMLSVRIVIGLLLLAAAISGWTLLAWIALGLFGAAFAVDVIRRWTQPSSLE